MRPRSHREQCAWPGQGRPWACDPGQWSVPGAGAGAPSMPGEEEEAATVMRGASVGKSVLHPSSFIRHACSATEHQAISTHTSVLKKAF